MTTTLLFVPTSCDVDINAVTLNAVQALNKQGKNTGYFLPFVQKKIALPQGFEKLNAPAPISNKELESALAIGNLDTLMEQVYIQFEKVQNDFVVCQGLVPCDSYAMQVNTAIASSLSALVVLVSGNDDAQVELAITAQAFGGQTGRVIGGIAPNGDKIGSFFATTNALTGEWLTSIIPADHKPALSPSAFRVALSKKAIEAKKRIVLPEGEEPRTIEAAAICQSRGIAQCILLAKRENVEQVANERGVVLPNTLQIIDPDTIRDKYIAPMVERRKGKLDEAGAAEQLKDTVVLGTMMLQLGDVDGLVSGAIHTTANTIRPAFQLIKTAPQYSLVSSSFFMLLPNEVVIYADCAVNPNPTAEELAEIAIQSADSARAFGMEPKVAMISYSTGTSGAGVDVDLVAEATRLVKEKAPNLAVDGPLQYDAAVVPSVAKSKAPNSPVAGKANVFIFPSLSVGNALYKAVQRNANVLSVGPMLQGLNKPVNDLSRGCLVDDIVYTIALTAVQATM